MTVLAAAPSLAPWTFGCHRPPQATSSGRGWQRGLLPAALRGSASWGHAETVGELPPRRTLPPLPWALAASVPLLAEPWPRQPSSKHPLAALPSIRPHAAGLFPFFQLRYCSVLLYVALAIIMGC